MRALRAVARLLVRLIDVNWLTGRTQAEAHYGRHRPKPQPRPTGRVPARNDRWDGMS